MCPRLPLISPSLFLQCIGLCQRHELRLSRYDLFHDSLGKMFSFSLQENGIKQQELIVLCIEVIRN